MQQRIQKIIAARGIASRRKAEEMILQGRVWVNGNTAHLGDTADDAEDMIYVDGKPLRKEPEKVYVMLHKPRGYVTTMSDERGRPAVHDLVQDCPERVYPVGRLDQYSEGLLLMTNDGELANRLMHPSSQTAKTYLVWVSQFTEEAYQKLALPIVLDGKPISKPQLKLIWHRDDTAQIRITIHEGRNRQIRRMCETAGMHANRLKRIREGSLELGDLQAGSWRYLTQTEIESLQK